LELFYFLLGASVLPSINGKVQKPNNGEEINEVFSDPLI